MKISSTKIISLTSILCSIVSCNGANLTETFNRVRQHKSTNNKVNNNNNNGSNNDDNDEQVSVFIGYKENVDAFSATSFSGLRGGSNLVDRISNVRSRYTSTNAINVVIKKSQLQSLQQNNPDIDYIEIDPIVYPYGEARLYGLSMVQADSLIIPNPPNSTSTVCSDPSSFKIGIIDSGLAVNHPDIPCGDITKSTTNCIGKEFGLTRSDGQWYNPVTRYHGTHVAGTIGAIFNSDGVQGMVNDGRFCFVIGRVFGESEGGTQMSTILSAVEWMVSKGVNVINMSLGTSESSRTGQSIMQKAYDAGVVLVGAAGNDGNTAFHYPASYGTVLSVAAVDSAYNKASFSQYNSGVDISAPGVDILSTFPLNLGGVLFIDSDRVSVTGDYLKYSVQKTTIQGTLVDCGLAVNRCSGPGGHICLIQRGLNNFETKALNCQASGGIGAIIYNNITGTIDGGLAQRTKVTIPTLQLTQVDGTVLRANGINTTVTISNRKGYSFLSGTSMSCPHVSGIVAKIWRPCPQCSNSQIIQCLQNTALDLGRSGRDDNYGYGLIQGEKAYLCLVNTQKCCSRKKKNV